VTPVEITPARAAERLQGEPARFVLVDCREPDEFRYVSVAGSVNIPMEQIPARLREIDGSKEVAVLCHRGVRSAMVVEFLRRAGFTTATSVRGGIEAWACEVDPSLRRY